MPLQHVFQIDIIEAGLRKQLFDARLVLGAAHACGNGHNVFSAENSGWHTFVVNALGLTYLRASDSD
jgi:hypothetical protein